MRFRVYRAKRLRRSQGFTLAEVVIIVLVIGILAAIATPSLTSMFENMRVDQAITEFRSALLSSQRSAIRGRQDCSTSLLTQLSLTEDNFQPSIGSDCSEVTPPHLASGVTVLSNLVPTPMSNILALNHRWIASNDVLVAARNSTGNSNQSGNQNGNGAVKSLLNGVDSVTNPLLNPPEAWSNWRQDNCQEWGGCDASDRANLGVVDVRFSAQGAIDFEIQSNTDFPLDSSGKIVALASGQTKGRQRCLVISRRIGLTCLGYYRGSLTPEAMTSDGTCTTLDWKKQ